MNRRLAVVGLAAMLVALCAYLQMHGPAPTAVSGNANQLQALPTRPWAKTPELADVPGSPARQELAERTTPSPTSETTRATPASFTLDVIVQYDGVPVPRASVDCYSDKNWRAGVLTDESRGAFVAQTGTDDTGTATFPQLAAGGYRLIVNGGLGDACHASVSFPEFGQHARIVVPLGTAILTGQVFTTDGLAAANATVFVLDHAYEQALSVWFSTRTDGSGAFEVRGLPGQPTRRVTALASGHRVDGIATAYLRAQETSSVIIGSPLGVARWSGTVRLPSGVPLEGPGRLYFRSKENDDIRDSAFDRGGNFTAWLYGASYIAQLSSPSGPVLGELLVVGEVTHDLTVPGMVLRGKVAYVGTKHPIARGPASEAVIELRRTDGQRSHASLVRGEQAYCFVGLEPGSYELTTRPWPLTVSADGRIAIDVTASLDEIAVDLLLTDAP